MEFLSAQYQINIRQPIEQFSATALRHAAHKPEHCVWPGAAGFGDDVLHFPQRLLLGQIPHAARVQKYDVRRRFTGSERIASCDQLRRDRFAVALVHLASVSFYVNTGHLKICSLLL